MLLFISLDGLREKDTELFQYISCYCLSYFDTEILPDQNNFNTSHVTVYRASPHWHEKFYIISIHLMLLFIVLFRNVLALMNNFNTSHVTVYLIPSDWSRYTTKFQYISCYCLSRRTRIHRGTNKISIHLMLLFIAVGIFPTLLIVSISIHLMLLFISL